MINIILIQTMAGLNKYICFNPLQKDSLIINNKKQFILNCEELCFYYNENVRMTTNIQELLSDNTQTFIDNKVYNQWFLKTVGNFEVRRETKLKVLTKFFYDM